MNNLKFGERVGVRPIREIQINSMDQSLRISIWNLIFSYIQGILYEDKEMYYLLASRIWNSFLVLPLDEFEDVPKLFLERLKKNFFESDWTYPYELIEFLCDVDKKCFSQAQLNRALEREYSGYRLLNGLIVPITNKLEIQEVKEASRDDGFSAAGSHIQKSLEMLSDKESPDYRNSIKESISAVEAIAKIITGMPNATLGQALKKIENKIPIHSSLKLGFEKIYGYTCDEGGLRHSFIDEVKNFTQADARYFLVSCSAFVNYLKELSNKT